MAREFIMTPVFDRQWRDAGLDDDDLQTLQSHLLDNPYAGDIVRETGGARKVRFAAVLNSGKSGSIRVMYLDITHLQKMYLLLCYPKSKQDNLTPRQKSQIRSVVALLKGAQSNG